MTIAEATPTDPQGFDAALHFKGKRLRALQSPR